VAHEQQTAISADALEGLQRLLGTEPARQRRVLAQALSLLRAPRLGRQLRGLACPDLGAEEDRVEFHADPRERDSGSPCLAFATLGQPALGVVAGAMRLGLGVT
jgi:hypothetical protein